MHTVRTCTHTHTLTHSTENFCFCVMFADAATPFLASMDMLWMKLPRNLNTPACGIQDARCGRTGPLSQLNCWPRRKSNSSRSFMLLRRRATRSSSHQAAGGAPHKTEKSENTYNQPKLPAYCLQLATTQCPPTNTHYPFQQLVRFFSSRPALQ